MHKISVYCELFISNTIYKICSDVSLCTFVEGGKVASTCDDVPLLLGSVQCRGRDQDRKKLKKSELSKGDMMIPSKTFLLWLMSV